MKAKTAKKKFLLKPVPGRCGWYWIMKPSIPTEVAERLTKRARPLEWPFVPIFAERFDGRVIAKFLAPRLECIPHHSRLGARCWSAASFAKCWEQETRQP